MSAGPFWKSFVAVANAFVTWSNEAISVAIARLVIVPDPFTTGSADLHGLEPPHMAHRNKSATYWTLQSLKNRGFLRVRCCRFIRMTHMRHVKQGTVAPCGSSRNLHVQGTPQQAALKWHMGDWFPDSFSHASISSKEAKWMRQNPILQRFPNKPRVPV